MAERNSAQRMKLKKRLFGRKRQMKCSYCPKILNIKSATLDHKLPLCKGGSWQLFNLCICCHDCNQKKADLSEEEFRAKIVCVVSYDPRILK